MSSIQQRLVQDRRAFLARFRLTYLCSLARERGEAVDLHDLALREAAELIELAASLVEVKKPRTK